MRRLLIILLINLLLLPHLSAQRDSVYHERQLSGLMAALDDSSTIVMAAALTALADTSWNGYLKKDDLNRIAEELEHKEADVRSSALYALGRQGNLEHRYLDKMVGSLADEDLGVRRSALYALGSQRNLENRYLDKMVEYLDEDLGVRRSALDALGRQENLEHRYLDKIVESLADESLSVRGSALSALGSQEQLEPYIMLQMLEQFTLNDRGYSVKPTDVIWELIRTEKEQLLFPALPFVVERAHWTETNREGYKITEKESETRIPLYEYSGASDTMLCLLKWFCRPVKFPDEIELPEARLTLYMVATYLDSIEKTPAFKEEILDALPILITQAQVPWEKQDTDTLQMFLTFLEENHSEGAAGVREVVNDLRRDKWLTALMWIIIAQVLLWVLFFVLYPRFTEVQQTIFWNPTLRKWLGFGYIGLLLSNVPTLRRYLFLPFQDRLLEDANPRTWDPKSYFANSTISQNKGQTGISTQEGLKTLKGQNILIGESGLGKSMYLRFWAIQSKRIVAFLPASSCTEGIVEAIEAKLPDHIQDKEFLQKLIYKGAIDLLIDGLNEISAQARANLIADLKQNFKGDLILSSQPMDWEIPGNIDIWYLNPLSQEQTSSFLLSRYESLNQQDIVPKSAFQDASRAYLEEVYSSNLPAETLINYRNILSNPMDLTSVAQLIARGEAPDLFQLQEQQYLLMAEDYKEKNLRQEFPLQEFSKAAFDMRLNDERELPSDHFAKEIKVMSRWKMVLSRKAYSPDNQHSLINWYFRHDKIWDYFLVQEFLNQPKIQEEFINDSRFRGVYLLLAFKLPYEDAMRLREMLIQHAADSRNHSVSDDFIQLIRGKKPKPKTERQKWIDAIKSAIAANEPEAALSILRNRIRSTDTDKQNQVDLLSGRLRELADTEINGTEDQSDLRKERSLLRKNILDLADAVQKAKGKK